MAVITFDIDKNTVSVLVEKTDKVHIKEKGSIELNKGDQYPVGKIFVNGEIETCIIRGERS